MTNHLTEYLDQSAAAFGDRTAVVDPSGSTISYADLKHQIDALAAFLGSRGIRRGDRVGMMLPKSVSAVVALFGIMKAGAAYVPVDHSTPVERVRGILTDCGIRAIVVSSQSLDVISSPSEQPLAAVVVVGESWEKDFSSVGFTPFEEAVGTVAGPSQLACKGSDLAYILYTSGSTGVPKGVPVSHNNAISFVDWCSSVFAPSEDDRFSSHAPFHFDLSVLDLFVSLKHGAMLFLISETLGKNPKELARFIAANKLTVWYSTPSILTLLLEFGHLETRDSTSLRLVLFAGEVFPVKHLRELQRRWSAPTYYNLYGPTETNVCTFAQVPKQIPNDRETLYPIGFPCEHCASLVLDTDGREVEPGSAGLLHISGPSVFEGYWNRPEDNALAFVERDGLRWYNTGDIVRWDESGGFTFLGRRDRMVKRHGYRIELGEIERRLYSHRGVREAAVVAVPGVDGRISIVAVMVCQGDRRPNLIELKSFCATHLPSYMSPDRFVFLDRLPRTSTDKTDYRTLRNQCSTELA